MSRSSLGLCEVGLLRLSAKFWVTAERTCNSGGSVLQAVMSTTAGLTMAGAKGHWFAM